MAMVLCSMINVHGAVLMIDGHGAVLMIDVHGAVQYD